MRVLALSGSLRRSSYNTSLLRVAAEVAPAGIAVELYEDLAGVPPYDADADGAHAPAAVRRLRESLAAAEAVLIATPEYNSSIPGQLKNALDWASRPFPDNALRSKTVAVIGASTSAYGGVWAQAELRKVLGAIGARVVERGLAVPRAAERFDESGELLDERLRRDLAQVIDELAAVASPVGAAA